MESTLKIGSCLFLLVAFSAGCGSDRPGTGLDAGTDSTVVADAAVGTDSAIGRDAVTGPSCMDVCRDKISECSPAATPEGVCAMVCRMLSQPSQVECLRTSSCAELEQAVERGDPICPLSAGCPGATPRCDGNSVVSCSGSTEITESCSSTQVCREGRCEDNAPACFPLNNTECSSVAPNLACCEGLSCFSGERGPGTTRCCIPVGSACDRGRDCCNYVDDDNPVTVDCVSGMCG